MTEHNEFEPPANREVPELPFAIYPSNFTYDPYSEILPAGVGVYLWKLTRTDGIQNIPFTSEEDDPFIYGSLAEDGITEISIGVFINLLHGNLASQSIHLGRYVWAYLDDRGTPACFFWANAEGYYACRIREGTRLSDEIAFLATMATDRKRHY